MSVSYDHGAPHPGNGNSAAAAGQPSEAEIGNIIIEAQRFADETALEARRAADAIVAQAQAEANRIVQEAQRQAGAPSTIPGTSIPTEAVSQLAATIDGFSRTNSALIEELSHLRQSLAAQVATASAPVAATRPSPVPAPQVAPTPQAAPVPQPAPIPPAGRVPVTQGMQGQARPIAPEQVQRSA
jgi:hypothetical protein